MKNDAKKIFEVKRDIEHKVGTSLRVLAKKYKVSKSYIHQVVGNKCGLTHFRRKKASLQTTAQKVRIKKHCMRRTVA